MIATYRRESPSEIRSPLSYRRVFALCFRLLAFGFLFGCACTDPQVSVRAEKRLLAEVDVLCRATGLHREGGLKSVRKSGRNFRTYLLTVPLSVEGATEDYSVEFDANWKPRYFGPINYRPQGTKGTGFDTLRDSSMRELCLRAVDKLNKSGLYWEHFGKAAIQKDGERGFRVSYFSVPEEIVEKGWAAMDPYITFLVSRRGFVYGVIYGA